MLQAFEFEYLSFYNPISFFEPMRWQPRLTALQSPGNRAIEGMRTEERIFIMNIARKLFSAGLAAATAAALAACTTTGPSEPPMAATPKGVEGSWIDAKGTGLSTFAGGSFKTVATDTGQKLADGTYTMTGATSVEINGTSLIRQTPVSFNCLMVSTSQLNCTSGTGQNFVLTRRA
jgi:predicted small lipoprotein YifL